MCALDCLAACLWCFLCHLSDSKFLPEHFFKYNLSWCQHFSNTPSLLAEIMMVCIHFPNQDQIFLPPLQSREVHLHANLRYGPDNPTLWPQPWVSVYCHLGAIPRKPDDSGDPLSIMWLVMLMGIDTRAGSQVRGSRGWGWVTKISPVIFPYLFGQVTGLWQRNELLSTPASSSPFRSFLACHALTHMNKGV